MIRGKVEYCWPIFVIVGLNIGTSMCEYWLDSYARLTPNDIPPLLLHVGPFVIEPIADLYGGHIAGTCIGEPPQRQPFGSSFDLSGFHLPLGMKNYLYEWCFICKIFFHSTLKWNCALNFGTFMKKDLNISISLKQSSNTCNAPKRSYTIDITFVRTKWPFTCFLTSNVSSSQVSTKSPFTCFFASNVLSSRVLFSNLWVTSLGNFKWDYIVSLFEF